MQHTTMSRWNVVTSRSLSALLFSTWLLVTSHQTRVSWPSQRIFWTTWRKTLMPVERHYSLVTLTSKSMIQAAVTPSSSQNCLIVLGWLTASSLHHMSMRTLWITSERETFVKYPSQGRLFSDHNVVLYDVVSTKLPKPPKKTRYRKYKATDTGSFGQDLAEAIASLNLDSM